MFKKVFAIPSPQELKDKTPLTAVQAKLKLKRDSEVKDIICGNDNRKLIIIGPCSADNEAAVLEYVSRLAKVYDKIKSCVMIVPRIYSGKPRTKGEGYKGIFHNPDPKKGTDIGEGILTMRKMLIRCLAESGLTAADEMLYPQNSEYIDDLLSYVAIGARSSENQYHRLVASGLDVAVGIKNPMNGSTGVLLNSIYAAQISNEFKYWNWQVKTDGNKYAHAVLRGGVDIHGNNVQNYHYDDVTSFTKEYEKSGLEFPSIIIDTNHSNSNKRASAQVRIVKEVLLNLKLSPTYARYFKGFMIESYLEEGRQEIGENIFGKSITDACLGWANTEKLLYEIAENV